MELETNILLCCQLVHKAELGMIKEKNLREIVVHLDYCKGMVFPHSQQHISSSSQSSNIIRTYI